MALLFFAVWLVLFIWRKDVRKEMLQISGVFAFAGPIADYFYFQDWWSPQTLSGSWISFEAFVTGFALGGVAAVLYEYMTHSRLTRAHGSKMLHGEKSLLILTLLVTVFVAVFVISNSFIATVVSLVVITGVILLHRRDLLQDSTYTAVGLMLIAQVVYSILHLATPGWVEAFWHFQNVPPMYIGALPIDDFFWYLCAGAAISPMYEYCNLRTFVEV